MNNELNNTAEGNSSGEDKNPTDQPEQPNSQQKKRKKKKKKKASSSGNHNATSRSATINVAGEALLEAVAEDNIEQLNLLLEQGVSPNTEVINIVATSRAGNGLYNLDLAQLNSEVANAEPEMVPILDFAINFDNIRAVQALLIAKCDPAIKRKLKRNALHVAVLSNREVRDLQTIHIKFLIAVQLINANPKLLDMYDDNRKTPTHYAAELSFDSEHNNGALFALFAGSGAAIHMKDVAGDTPFTIYAKRVVKHRPHLINKRFITPANNEETQATLLHIACKKGDVELITLLLKAGANKNALDSNGKTPLELVTNKQEEITTLFSKYKYTFPQITKLLKTHEGTLNDEVYWRSMFQFFFRCEKKLENVTTSYKDAFLEGIQDYSETAIKLYNAAYNEDLSTFKQVLAEVKEEDYYNLLFVLCSVCVIPSKIRQEIRDASFQFLYTNRSSLGLLQTRLETLIVSGIRWKQSLEYIKELHAERGRLSSDCVIACFRGAVRSDRHDVIIFLRQEYNIRALLDKKEYREFVEHAIFIDRIEMVDALTDSIELYKEDFVLKRSVGVKQHHSYLDFAVESGNVEISRLLINRYPILLNLSEKNNTLGLDVKEHAHERALMTALKLPNNELIKLLLESGPEIDILKRTVQSSINFLLQARSENKVMESSLRAEATNILLRHYLPILRSKNDKDTFLSKYIIVTDLSVIKTAYEAGLREFTIDHGLIEGHPTSTAAVLSYLKYVLAPEEFDRLINSVDKDGNNLLLYSIKQKMNTLARFLIENHCGNLLATNSLGETALHVALKSKNFDLLEPLLKKIKSTTTTKEFLQFLNRVDKKRETALAIAHRASQLSARSDYSSAEFLLTTYLNTARNKVTATPGETPSTHKPEIPTNTSKQSNERNPTRSKNKGANGANNQGLREQTNENSNKAGTITEPVKEPVRNPKEEWRERIKLLNVFREQYENSFNSIKFELDLAITIFDKFKTEAQIDEKSRGLLARTFREYYAKLTIFNDKLAAFKEFHHTLISFAKKIKGLSTIDDQSIKEIDAELASLELSFEKHMNLICDATPAILTICNDYRNTLEGQLKLLFGKLNTGERNINDRKAEKSAAGENIDDSEFYFDGDEDDDRYAKRFEMFLTTPLPGTATDNDSGSSLNRSRTQHRLEKKASSVSGQSMFVQQHPLRRILKPYYNDYTSHSLINSAKQEVEQILTASMELHIKVLALQYLLSRLIVGLNRREELVNKNLDYRLSDFRNLLIHHADCLLENPKLLVEFCQNFIKEPLQFLCPSNITESGLMQQLSQNAKLEKESAKNSVTTDELEKIKTIFITNIALINQLSVKTDRQSKFACKMAFIKIGECLSKLALLIPELDTDGDKKSLFESKCFSEKEIAFFTFILKVREKIRNPDAHKGITNIFMNASTTPFSRELNEVHFKSLCKACKNYDADLVNQLFTSITKFNQEKQESCKNYFDRSHSGSR